MGKKRVLLAIAILSVLLSVSPSFGGRAPGFGAGSTGGSLVRALEYPNLQKGDPGEIERKVQELLQELERLQKEAEQKFRKDILPHLQKEIERLKEWLRDLRPDKRNEPETRET
jgi:hypothetical protein